MKNKNSGRYQLTAVTHILIAALIASLAEVFLVTNLRTLGRFALEEGKEDSLLALFAEPDTVILLLYLLTGILIFTAVFLILQLGSLRYISRLSEAMQQIAEGDLNTRIEVEGNDEFSVMASVLNQMAEELRAMMDREREAERTKNELITNLAHDLRTPLTSIIGYLELLAGREDLPAEQQKKYLEITFTKAKRLRQLLEELFGFTKLSYGRINMKVGQVDIVKLLEQLLEEAYPNFTERQLSYELKSNVPSKMINADGSLLARLFDNLISNAIKYGAEGKQVTVRIRAEEEKVTVSVTNFGQVIPKEELPLLFQKFYRMDQARSSGTGGTGLGLAIAKEIAEMHGGSIRADSDLNGTVFTVVLRVHFDLNKEQFAGPGD